MSHDSPGTTAPTSGGLHKSSHRPVVSLVLLVIILLISTAIRVYRIGDGLGGFHASDEAENVLAAESFRSGSILRPSPDGEHVRLKTPPLYPYMIYSTLWFSPSPLVGARLISLLAGLLSIVLVYNLGTLFFSPSAGLMAAALYAFTPMSSIVHHNAHPDSLFVVLLLLAHFLYFRSQTRNGNLRGAGLLFGAACLTKLVAWMSLPALLVSEIWRHRGVGWLRQKRIWIAAGLALAVFTPFYLYHGLTDFPYLVNDLLSSGPAAASAPQFSALELIQEVLWGFSPLIALLFLLGFLAGLPNKEWPSRYLVLQVLFYVGFFLVVDRPSYFLVVVTPFLALLAAATLTRLRLQVLKVAATTVAALTGIVVTLVVLCQVKYGWDAFVQLGNFYRSECSNCAVLVTREFLRNHGWVPYFTFGPQHIVNVERSQETPEGELVIDSLQDRLLLFDVIPGRHSGADLDVNRTIFVPVLLGLEFHGEQRYVNRFDVPSLSVRQSQPWKLLEIKPIERRGTVAFMYIRRDKAIMREGDRLFIKESP